MQHDSSEQAGSITVLSNITVCMDGMNIHRVTVT